MSTLRIYFSAAWRDSASPCAWALCDEKGALLQSGSDPLAALPKGHDCIAIAAPDRVLCLAAKLPPGSRRRQWAALPFLAEENLLTDPEESHVVPGPTQADGRSALAVVDKNWLRRIVEACRAAQLSLRRMIPETFLPAPAPGAWTLVWDGAGGFLRTGPASGMALDAGDAQTAPLALRLLAAQAAPAKIEVRFPQHVAEAQRGLPQWEGLGLSVGAAWDWRRERIPADALNLLWGEFAPRLKLGEWWPRLRPAVLILLAALAVEIVGYNAEWALLAREKARLTREMAQTFHSTFGASSALVNAPLQMRRNLAQLRHAAGQPDEGDFLPLLDAAAASFAALPAGSVRALHYEPGRLDVDVRLARGGDFQALRQQLGSRGLSVQAGSVRDAGNGSEARLTLQAGGGQ